MEGVKGRYIVAVLSLSICIVALLGMARNTKVCGLRVPAARAQIDAFMIALEMYKSDTGQYPSTEEGLTALRIRPGSTLNWQGPYLPREVPRDPWGREYIYTFPAAHGSGPDIVSYGADGRPGGKGKDSDTMSWKPALGN
jgi:general secretion pathway protein G